MPTLEEVRAERARREQQQQSVRVQAAAGGQPVSVEAIRRERARRASERMAAEQPRTAADEAEGGLAALNQGVFLGWGDEIVGLQGRLLEGGREFVDQLSSGQDYDPQAIRDAGERGYRAYTDRSRGALQDFREDRPLAAAGLEGTGAAAPIIATMGQAAPASGGQAVARGFGGWANQSARAGASGSLYGSIYGAGAADEGDRVQGARQGALVGGAIGAATPTATNAAMAVFDRTIRPAWRGLVAQAERIPTPTPNTVGMGAGNMFAGGRSGALQPPAQQPPPQVPNSAANTVDRLAGRRQMTAQQVDDALRGARENPQGEVLADVFGDPGVRTTRAIAQSPGQTGQVATERAFQRFHEAPDRIMTELNRRLGVGESRSDAIRALEREYAEASDLLYNPLWREPTTPQQRAAFDQRIGPLLDDPILQDAMRRGEAIFEREVRLGSAQGNIQDNLARYLHYVKMGLDDAVGAARRDPTGIQSTEMRGVMELRNRYVQAVDEIVPGYRDARSRWGGLREAEDALEEGAAFLRMRPDEIAGRMQELSPFAQHHARIGLATEIETKLGLRGSVNGNRNVAEMLGSPEMQRRVAAAFESPQQAADFLDTLNRQNVLMRNAGQWNTGSQTYSNALHGADEGIQALAEIAGNTVTGNVGAAVRRGAGFAQNVVTMGAAERANNQRGAALLTRIDTQESKAFADEIVRILRERETQRAARDAAAPVTGAAAALANERNQRQ